ncbi:AraC family transcriptional regulator [Paenibacillus sp. J5C_2022]|nr:AraC family transcriptional regulator [Paenibacillus sp. J5C2022]
MNKAVDYIEEHLADKIDYGEAAKIVGCSMHHFQRIFPYMANVSLSEYVRRRRLTLAAYELQNSGVKVIDLALKYGYDSPEAFARAFQKLHGTTPSAARSSGVRLQAYSPITFQITVRGVEGMNYRIEQLDQFSVVGIQERVLMEESFHRIQPATSTFRHG